jgi:hypothetical protein
MTYRFKCLTCNTEFTYLPPTVGSGLNPLHDNISVSDICQVYHCEIDDRYVHCTALKCSIHNPKDQSLIGGFEAECIEVIQ